jgi:hypothetical protein
MYKQFYENMPFTALPLLGLGLFFVVFVLICSRTLVFKSADDFDSDARIPLADGPEAKS